MTFSNRVIEPPLVSISGTPTQGQTLTASNNLADDDGLGTVYYQWNAAGSPIAGATGKTLLLTQALVGQPISVSASYTDLQGTAESVTSSVTVPIADVNEIILPFNQAAVKQNTATAALGPNPDNPYFHVRFSLPVPPDNDKLRNGPLVGIDSNVADHHNSPAFEIMPNGDALMISYSGPSDREFGRDLLLAQTRLRHGTEEFDMPEHLNVGGKNLLNLTTSDGNRVLAGPPLLWREGNVVWLFLGGYNFQGIPQPPADVRPGGFRVFKSMDSGTTWEIVALEPVFSDLSMDSQPIVNAFRAPTGEIYVATDGKDGAGTSGLWRSSDNGLSWTDVGGRTSGRHSTIVPLNDTGGLLSFGGKNTQIDSYMPQSTSTDWGKALSRGLAVTSVRA